MFTKFLDMLKRHVNELKQRDHEFYLKKEIYKAYKTRVYKVNAIVYKIYNDNGQLPTIIDYVKMMLTYYVDEDMKNYFVNIVNNEKIKNVKFTENKNVVIIFVEKEKQ